MKKEIVAVAMSGGVDSSIASYILKKKGFNVVGLHMNHLSYIHRQLPDLYENNKQDAGESLEAWCKKIDIPLIEVDLSKEFMADIVRPFISDYIEGRTPNPCLICNKKIKFGYLLDVAISIGASYIATGHYVRKYYFKDTGRYHLHCGIDKGKDQSYFLSRLNQQELKHALFPLGTYRKVQVYKIADEIGYPALAIKESQEVCFLPKGSYHRLIERLCGNFVTKTGPIVDVSGRRLGRHKGLYRYTIGQRRGLGIRMGKPYYVVGIDIDRNSLIVGPEGALNKRSFKIKDPNWIPKGPPSKKFKAFVKIRYRHMGASATILNKDKTWRVVFDDPQRAITPGQAAVFYLNNCVLGSGWIEEVYE